jgi:hypothetical protein
MRRMYVMAMQNNCVSCRCVLCGNFWVFYYVLQFTNQYKLPTNRRKLNMYVLLCINLGPKTIIKNKTKTNLFRNTILSEWMKIILCVEHVYWFGNSTLLRITAFLFRSCLHGPFCLSRCGDCEEDGDDGPVVSCGCRRSLGSWVPTPWDMILNLRSGLWRARWNLMLVANGRVCVAARPTFIAASFHGMT